MTEPGPRWEPQSPPRAENAANFFRSSARAARWSSAVVSTPRVHWRAILGIGRGIANARARSVAAPLANREPQKPPAEGQKCGQLFSVEREARLPFHWMECSRQGGGELRPRLGEGARKLKILQLPWHRSEFFPA